MMTAALTLLWMTQDASPEGLYDQFESGSGGWSFQHLNEQVRWQIDATPQVYVSPSSTLNNIDATAGSGASGIGEAVAISPSAGFVTANGRIIEHWCRTFVIADGAPFRRKLSLGASLLTEGAAITFLYDTPDSTNDDVEAGPHEYVIQCPSGGDWHKHRYYFPPDGSDLSVNNSEKLRGSEADVDPVVNSITLQAAFFFQWHETTSAGGGGAVVTGGVIGWMVDDLVIVPSTTGKPVGNPFNPQPGEDGGGGFGCVNGSVPQVGSPAALLALLMAAALVVVFR